MTDSELVMMRLSWRDDCAQLIEAARRGVSMQVLAARSGMKFTKFLVVVSCNPEFQLALARAYEDFLATK